MARAMLNPMSNDENREAMQNDAEQTQPVRRDESTAPQQGEPPQGSAPSQEVYASAFPAWDLLPPQIMIRRVNRKR